jgi:antitoxin (DNA-binding transcriptional repressor) of toxin-antitoxin stability system
MNPVDTMPISKFKATCLAALARVRKTGRPLRVTRFGKPVADIHPSAPTKRRPDWLGGMKGTLEIKGDITGPTGALVEWEVMK